MQIVIDIDDEVYERIMQGSNGYNDIVNHAIRYGSPIDFKHSLEYKQGAIDCINMIQKRLREIEI